ncbi:hypothetical protein [Chitinophaga sp. S165]|uniref:hypothetical protein n=1 Tax=Chitinophaga sp. S165 TaxID=2135462 RepID=UPI000D70B367|nr:hypothetical protein [Chitinophaga sp. S165]PWV45787.1 hypothetical protein C7475_1124 [Chitinophaga sp. S165]
MDKQYLNINFIRHLNAFYTVVHEHERLRASDISLYVALFQLWNLERFPVSLVVNRALAMKLCKIGSLHTYTQCLKRLHNFGFLTYEPSDELFSRSVIKMLPLEKDKGAKNDTHACSNKDPANGSKIDTDRVSILTHFNNKQINNFINESKTAHTRKKSKDKIKAPPAPELEAIRTYFRAAAQSDREAELFYFHYKAIGWTMGGMPILDWTAAAEKWISRIPLIKNNAIANTTSTVGGLRSEKNKRYDEPF